MLRISRETLEILKEETCRNYPKECCGFLLGGNSGDGVRFVKMIRPGRNLAPKDEQGVSFFITSEELMQEEIFAEQIGMEIVGVYHSHPDEQAEISARDRAYMIPGLSYPVLAICRERVVELKSFEKKFRGWTESVSEEQICVEGETLSLLTSYRE